MILTEPTLFFMVWTKRGHAPRFIHDTLVGATDEAARLAGLHPGQKFVVLQALAKLSARPEAPDAG